MLFKCIEQDHPCPKAKKLDKNWYCDHKPDHVWEKLNGMIQQSQKCADRKDKAI